MEMERSPHRGDAQLNERMEMDRSPRRRISPSRGDACTEVERSPRRGGNRRRERGSRRCWRQPNGRQP
uniref:Uncharacterized protein n=1 Tax=Glossina pallidipes TaxID=7398 RepID=A0A1A9ZYP0_GLOPL